MCSVLWVCAGFENNHSYLMCSLSFSLSQKIGDIKKIMDSFQFTRDVLSAPPSFPDFEHTPTPSPTLMTDSANDDDLVRLLAQGSGKGQSKATKRVTVLSGV